MELKLNGTHMLLAYANDVQLRHGGQWPSTPLRTLYPWKHSVLHPFYSKRFQHICRSEISLDLP
jgi:hypothetical protein